jgi:hypothetical protein
VDKVDLPAAFQFAQDGVADQVFVEARHVGADRLAVDRRGVDDRQVTDAGQAQV